MRYLKTVTNVLCSIIARIFTPFVKRKKKNIAFGSWLGKGFIDNSRYLFEYIYHNFPSYNLFWVGEKKILEEIKTYYPNCNCVQINNFRQSLKLLSCKYFFFSQDHDLDICRYNVFKGAVTCYLHHGVPVKKWGDDGLNTYQCSSNSIHLAIKKILKHISGSDIQYDYFVTASPIHDKINITALRSRGCTLDKNIHSGTPRNDMLANYNHEIAEDFKMKYSCICGFDGNAHVLLYLPTYRRVSDKVFSFKTITEEQYNKLSKILQEKNIIIIEKSHFAEKVKYEKKPFNGIVFVDDINVQEMLMFADYMISDYSGAFLDFLILDRPIIHFAYDYDFYKNVDSGLYFEIEDFAAGPIARTYDELLNAIETIEENKKEYALIRASQREKYMKYEIGTSSKQIFDKIVISNVE